MSWRSGSNINSILFTPRSKMSQGYPQCLQDWHLQGQWHGGCDIISSNTVAMMEAFLCLFLRNNSIEDVQLLDNIDAIIESATLQSITDYNNDKTVTSVVYIFVSGQNDKIYTTLTNSIEHRFPNIHSLTNSDIHDF